MADEIEDNTPKLEVDKILIEGGEILLRERMRVWSSVFGMHPREDPFAPNGPTIIKYQELYAASLAALGINDVDGEMHAIWNFRRNWPLIG